MKRVLSLILAVIVILSASVTALAADTGFDDVPENAWYADAVAYVRDNGLMSGTSATTFSPDAATSRGQIATILYRAAGSPAVTGGTNFSDVSSTAYYATATRWASANGIVTGYPNGNFGPDEPITRQQIAAILWRCAGSPAADRGTDFADESTISAYASTAVDWARENGIMNGKDGNRFDPNGNATRAQAAVILRNYMQRNSTAPEPAPDSNPTPAPSGSRSLVVYFSASGNTETAAEYIADAANADLFELVPVDPYTDADLNWTADGSRVNQEHENESLRDVKLAETTVTNWADYDTVFIGYPIWWGIAAWPVNDFIQSNDFSGKTVIPFCTSTSSGLGQSAELLEELAGNGNWLEGRRFSERVSQSDVQSWIDSLDLNPNTTSNNNDTSQESRILITYFSMPDNVDDSTVTVNGQTLGNNQYFAQVIQEATGADVFRIEPATPYPTDHSTLVDQASEEQDTDARPAIRDRISGFDDYDVVFVGYPIWWSDLPQIMYTFFDTYDFSGKTMIPFNTHGGSGWAGTLSTIAEMEPNATMLDGLSISRNSIQDARQEIIDWVDSLAI